MPKVRSVIIPIGQKPLQAHPIKIGVRGNLLEQIKDKLPSDCEVYEIKKLTSNGHDLFHFYVRSSKFKEVDEGKEPVLELVMVADSNLPSGIRLKEVRDLEKHLEKQLPTGAANKNIWIGMPGITYGPMRSEDKDSKNDKDENTQQPSKKEADRLRDFFFQSNKGMEKCNCGVKWVRHGGRHARGCPARKENE